MKSKAIRLLLLTAVFLTTGCQFGNVRSGQINDDNQICGIWQTQGEKKIWKFVLENDGTLSEVFRPDGLHMILSDGGIKQEPVPNLFAHYIYGPCTWSYDAVLKSLKVKVVIDDFYVKANTSELNCKVIDEFEGPLSDDGVWTATWQTLSKFDPPALDQVADGGTLTFVKE